MQYSTPKNPSQKRGTFPCPTSLDTRAISSYRCEDLSLSLCVCVCKKRGALGTCVCFAPRSTLNAAAMPALASEPAVDAIRDAFSARCKCIRFCTVRHYPIPRCDTPSQQRMPTYLYQSIINLCTYILVSSPFGGRGCSRLAFLPEPITGPHSDGVLGRCFGC